MKKEIINVSSVDKEGKFCWEAKEINNLSDAIMPLKEEAITKLIALVQFQQRVNKLFFDDHEVFNEYLNNVEKLAEELLKIKEPTDQDLTKFKKALYKEWDSKCDINGKSILFEVAKKLLNGIPFKDIVAWTFSIGEVYCSDFYDWMY